MKKSLMAIPALALTAACIPPQGISEADMASWDAAVASMGCVLETERQYVPVELQTGMPREKLIEIAQYKVGLKQVVGLESGGVRLVTGPCAPQIPTQPDIAPEV